jgi:hypothetical protein
MSANKENAAIVGVGAVACAACCAGPILGFLAALGLGTAAGFAVFGSAALVIGAIVTVVVLRRRRQRAARCAAPSTPVAVDVPTMRSW